MIYPRRCGAAIMPRRFRVSCLGRSQLAGRAEQRNSQQPTVGSPPARSATGPCVKWFRTRAGTAPGRVVFWHGWGLSPVSRRRTSYTPAGFLPAPFLMFMSRGRSTAQVTATTAQRPRLISTGAAGSNSKTFVGSVHFGVDTIGRSSACRKNAGMNCRRRTKERSNSKTPDAANVEGLKRTDGQTARPVHPFDRNVSRRQR